MAISHNFHQYEIDVTDEKIEEYARKYISLRSYSTTDFDTLSTELEGVFDLSRLKEIIQQDSVPIQNSKSHFNDIYRSDLGELIMVHFFEEEISRLCPGESVFIIPVKNISTRELADQPGRGLDAIGYRDNGNGVTILLGEAKVSEEKSNPPQVVHSSDDSIYKTQLKYKKDKSLLRRRLSDYLKKIPPSSDYLEHIQNIGGAVIALKDPETSNLDILFGCCLVRDTDSVCSHRDYGKMKSEADSTFLSDKIHFAIPTFKRPISEVVALFFQKVQELS